MGTTLSWRSLCRCHWLSAAQATGRSWRSKDLALLSLGPDHPTCNDVRCFACPQFLAVSTAPLRTHPSTTYHNPLGLTRSNNLGRVNNLLPRRPEHHHPRPPEGLTNLIATYSFV